MEVTERFEHYLEYLAEGLGHSDRHSGLRGYCTGLMSLLSISERVAAAGVEPMSMVEINAEVKAMRAERRRRAGIE